MFKKLFTGLAKTKNNLIGQVKTLFGSRKIDDKLFNELEDILISADIGVATTAKLLSKMKELVRATPSTTPIDALKSAMQALLQPASSTEGLLEKVNQGAKGATSATPYVILVVGINGVGKTTSIAKLATYFKANGKKVLLSAADTFRAAAVEQLEIWADRTGVDIVKGQTGSDSAAVVFDTIKAGIARGADVVIADTAGRLHTKVNLMAELKKMVRVSSKALDGAPHELLLVLDATIGQNAVSQAKSFSDAVGVTGLILTKMDSSGRGGVIFPVVDQLHTPVYFLGIGEQDSDLVEFDPAKFIDELFRE